MDFKDDNDICLNSIVSKDNVGQLADVSYDMMEDKQEFIDEYIRFSNYFNSLFDFDGTFYSMHPLDQDSLIEIINALIKFLDKPSVIKFEDLLDKNIPTLLVAMYSQIDSFHDGLAICFQYLTRNIIPEKLVDFTVNLCSFVKNCENDAIENLIIAINNIFIDSKVFRGIIHNELTKCMVDLLKMKPEPPFMQYIFEYFSNLFFYSFVEVDFNDEGNIILLHPDNDITHIVADTVLDQLKNNFNKLTDIQVSILYSLSHVPDIVGYLITIGIESKLLDIINLHNLNQSYLCYNIIIKTIEWRDQNGYDSRIANNEKFYIIMRNDLLGDNSKLLFPLICRSIELLISRYGDLIFDYFLDHFMRNIHNFEYDKLVLIVSIFCRFILEAPTDYCFRITNPDFLSVVASIVDDQTTTTVELISQMLIKLFNDPNDVDNIFKQAIVESEILDDIQDFMMESDEECECAAQILQLFER